MDLLELLRTHGLWVLAVACLLEGETVLVLAGFAAHRGWLDPVAVLVVAAAAGFTGDQAFFWLGRRRGSAVLARFPSVAAQRPRVERLVGRWHDGLVVGVRFAWGLRVAGPVLIGMAGGSPWRFAAFNALGAALWALLVGGIGWTFGAAAEAMLGRLHHLEGVLAALLAAGLVTGAVVHAVWRRRRAARASGRLREDPP